jgi:hypothetical protein
LHWGEVLLAARARKLSRLPTVFAGHKIMCATRMLSPKKSAPRLVPPGFIQVW